ncbi:MAG: phosphatase domain-containing protein [Burkholderiaceae bacterium]
MRTISHFIARDTAPIVAAILAFSSFTSCAITAANGPTQGQEVVFFPSIASVSSDQKVLLTIQGRVFEPTENSRGREALIDVLAPLAGASRTDPLFRSRASYFVSDSNRNVRVSVKVGDRVIVLPASNPAGYFIGDVTLTNDEIREGASGGVILFQSLPTASNPQMFAGNAVLVPEEGVTVITDMDDTIKVTDILDHQQKVANTFVREFIEVPGMSALYRSWMQALGSRTHFHVVSAGPWQFNEPLRRFTQKAEFPVFTWDMRSVDIGDVSVLIKESFPDPEDVYEFKLQKIQAFMARFPKRHVVLVGDSGEKDPEVYAKVLSEFPNSVDAVFIRNVTREDQKDRRYQKLFPSGAAAAKLRVFLDPKELPPLIPPPIVQGANPSWRN